MYKSTEILSLQLLKFCKILVSLSLTQGVINRSNPLYHAVQICLSFHTDSILRQCQENGKTPHGVKQGSLSLLGYKLQYNLKIINMCEKSMKFVKIV